MSKRLLLQPDLVLGGIITDLTPEILQANQIEGLILDVDETLVPIKEDAVTPDLARWAEEMRQVASIWLVSNNLSHNRIGNIARSLDLPYFLGARKPSRRKLLQAAMAMNLPVEKVAMVGDRLFTDVIAGNRLGMFTILVEPMVNPLIAEREYPIRNFEVWISEILGVTLATKE
jgi:HAD superfamily phosphatase (TIGR01668 family)